MTGDKIAGALGLCAKAGKVTVGTYLAMEQLRKGKVGAVLLAEDAGKDAERKLSVLASRQEVLLKRIPLSKSRLAMAVGKKGEAVCVAVSKEFLNLVLASL